MKGVKKINSNRAILPRLTTWAHNVGCVTRQERLYCSAGSSRVLNDCITVGCKASEITEYLCVVYRYRLWEIYSFIWILISCKWLKILRKLLVLQKKKNIKKFTFVLFLQNLFTLVTNFMILMIPILNKNLAFKWVFLCKPKIKLYISK